MNTRCIKIFLVDDDQIFHFTAKKMLDAIDVENEVSFFANGEEAMRFLDRNATTSDALPDVIFLDINMPVMNGWEFLEEYNKRTTVYSKAPTIFVISSSVRECDYEKVKDYPHVQDYVYKPLVKEKFKELLSLLVASPTFCSAH